MQHIVTESNREIIILNFININYFTICFSNLVQLSNGNIKNYTTESM